MHGDLRPGSNVAPELMLNDILLYQDQEGGQVYKYSNRQTALYGEGTLGACNGFFVFRNIGKVYAVNFYMILSNDLLKIRLARQSSNDCGAWPLFPTTSRLEICIFNLTGSKKMSFSPTMAIKSSVELPGTQIFKRKFNPFIKTSLCETLLRSESGNGTSQLLKKFTRGDLFSGFFSNIRIKNFS